MRLSRLTLRLRSLPPVDRVGAALGRVPHKTPEATRLRIVIASFIAITSLLAAIGAWRASIASSGSNNADRKGFADAVARARAEAGIRASLAGILVDFNRARAYETQALEFRKQARDEHREDRTRMLALAESNERLAKVARDSIDTDALRPNGSLDLARKFDLELKLQEGLQDLNPGPEFRSSDELSTRAERRVGVTALLVAAALFLTLAQVARRRVYAVYLATGLGVLSVSTVLLVLLEVGT